ncbi:MAG: hypothetical protein C4570_06130 [Ammonifex sp.]|jgi:hypothetical protein|nr:MAG: hypothetical protein C4570_06130 [Ammonifex sp.]
MKSEDEYLGYLKYSGKLVEAGLLGARKSAQALLGFDEAIRFFATQQIPELQEVEFEIPVLIRHSSWEALIPNTIVDWIVTALGIGATAYIGTAATEMAKADFQGRGIKEVLIKSLQAILETVRLGKHLRNLRTKVFERLIWRNNNSEVGIPNTEGEYLYFPLWFIRLFPAVPPDLLAKVAEIVKQDLQLSIGVRKANVVREETITIKDKSCFILEKDNEDQILYPELIHGQPVVLEGVVTRGNKSTNSLGFLYKDHILLCYPATGTIVKFKPALFLKSRVHGIVSRADKFGMPTESKPKIIVSRIEPLEHDSSSNSLFKET